MGRKAIIGEWYLTPNDDAQFEVVALDDAAGTIDVQYFDGSIGEFDLETWNEMELDSCAAPEDWSGPYEMELDEVDDTDESAYLDLEDFSPDGLRVHHETELEHVY